MGRLGGVARVVVSGVWALTLSGRSTVAAAQAADPQQGGAAPAPAPAGEAPPPAGNPPPSAAPPADAPQPGYPPPQSGYPPPQQPAYPPPGYPPPANPPSGYPPRYPPPPGYGPSGYPPGVYGAPVNVHDGFYLHLHLGGGFTAIKGEDGTGSQLTLSGASASFGIALGGVVAPNLVVFGEVFGTVTDSPNVTIDGTDMGSTSDTATVAGLGAGLAYYVQPANFYLAGAIAAMSFSLDDSDGNNLYESETGFGVQAIVGKEWWVSQDWGLGLAAEVMAATMKDKADRSITWTAASFSILFSATYN